jgi:hypothetical protein
MLSLIVNTFMHMICKRGLSIVLGFLCYCSHHSNKLYVAARLYYLNKEDLIANILRQGEGTGSDDRLGLKFLTKSAVPCFLLVSLTGPLQAQAAGWTITPKIQVDIANKHFDAPRTEVAPIIDGIVGGELATAQSGGDVDIQSGQGKTIQMVRTATPPKIDGIMDEVWSTAPAIVDLHQVNPIEYAAPSEKTVIRVLYDENFLYVSGMLYYDDLDDITANQMIQNANLQFDDKFRIYINPFNDGRNGYLFQINANGIRSEAIVENVRNLNWDWTSIWFSSATATDYGWFGEIAIPYKTISFDPNSDTWGISLYRDIMTKKESIAWTSYNRSVDPSNFASAQGFSDLEQGLGLDLIPGFTMTNRQTYNPSTSETELDPTLDVFYKMTPNLTAALTFNSDFSATDVDARQVQLTRFNLFFPEQRRFFLQEADIFEFGGIDRNAKPFFSRRIGIGPNGEQVDVEAGGKLTGRVGRWNVGGLAVKQAGNSDIVSEGGRVVNDSDLFVGRVSANVLEQSTIGAIATSGNPDSDESNSVVGADFNYLNTRSFDNVTVQGQAWYQQSNTGGLEGEDSAWGARLLSPNQVGFKGRIQYTEIGKNFFPALGFVNRTGIKQSELVIGHTKRFSAGSWLRSFENQVIGFRISNIEGDLQSEQLEFRLSKVENQTGDEAFLLITDNREVLSKPFRITDEVTIPVGDYYYQRYGVDFKTGGYRALAANLHLENGGFFSGDRSTVNASITWQSYKNFIAVFEYEYNKIDLPEGNFNTQLLRLRTNIAFTSEWAWITTAQYDNQSELLGINSRLQWIPRAGSEFYIIYNGGWIDRTERGFERVGESATIKIGHTLRF